MPWSASPEAAEASAAPPAFAVPCMEPIRDGVAGNARGGRVHARGGHRGGLLFRQLLGVMLAYCP